MHPVQPVLSRFASRFLIQPSHGRVQQVNLNALFHHIQTEVSPRLSMEVSRHQVFVSVPDAHDVKLREVLGHHHLRCVQTYPRTRWFA